MARAFVLTGLLLVAALAGAPAWYAVFPAQLPELPPAGRQVELSPGLAVNVIEMGTGAPVLLVHGHPGCAYDWLPAMRELASRGHRAIAYDRVGYGRSSGRAGSGAAAVAIETNVAELLQLLQALELRAVTLVGWSYGGGMSILAAKRDPSRIARIALIASVGPGVQRRTQLPRPLLAWVSRVPVLVPPLLAATSGVAFHPSPVPGWFLTQLEANFASPHTLRSNSEEGQDLPDADLDPAPLVLPILIVHGREDQVVPLAIAEALHARAASSQLLSIPEGGHMLPVTHAELLAEALYDFARDRPVAR
jgi:non-heme chloroperoxidase